MNSKKAILCWLLLLKTGILFAQKDSVYYTYADAFQHPAAVKKFVIYCVHNDGLIDVCDSIPSRISEFVNLEELDIDEGGFRTIPMTINRLQKLKIVRLTSFKIDYNIELCKLEGLKNLRELHINFHHKVSSPLPECIGSIKSIVKITLGHNHSEYYDWLKIIHVLKQLPQLKYLNLAGAIENNLSEDISQLTTIQYLDLSENVIKSLKPLYGMKKLRELNLIKTKIDEKEIKMLRVKLPHCKIITDGTRK